MAAFKMNIIRIKPLRSLLLFSICFRLSEMISSLDQHRLFTWLNPPHFGVACNLSAASSYALICL
jgi:hypothetical protein